MVVAWQIMYPSPHDERAFSSSGDNLNWQVLYNDPRCSRNIFQTAMIPVAWGTLQILRVASMISMEAFWTLCIQVGSWATCLLLLMDDNEHHKRRNNKLLTFVKWGVSAYLVTLVCVAAMVVNSDVSSFLGCGPPSNNIPT